MKKALIALATATALAACSQGPTSFSRWADRALERGQNITTDNVLDIDPKEMALALACVSWPTATDAQMEKAPAELAKSATDAGYESSADDARDWLDSNCVK